jgi:hypothetical protein
MAKPSTPEFRDNLIIGILMLSAAAAALILSLWSL